MLLSVFPELEKPGGIQRLGGHVALAQLRAARERGMELRVLSLNDPPGARVLNVAAEEVPFTSFGRNHARFILATLSNARHARILHVDHVFLAPPLLVAKAINPRLVTHVHLHGIEIWSRRSALQRLALRRSDWIVSVSNYSLQRMREVQSVEPRQACVMHAPLDPSFLSAPAGLEPALSHLRGKRFLLTIARLATTEKFKGVRTAINAFARIAPAHPDVHYVIGGGGNDVDNLRAEVAALGLADRIHLPGRLTDESLRWLYANCEAFVLPSAKEGFGIVFLEAMAFAKPCIGGNTGGTPEIIVEGETGYLTAWDDTHTIAEAMNRLLSDPDLRTQLGAAAKKRLDQSFTFSIFAQRMAELIDESLGERR
jgi:phosphatidylinositol alpha-1,6-mannosyltransferase